MTEEELIKFLKENLKIEIEDAPDIHDIGSGTIIIKLLLGKTEFNRSMMYIKYP